MNNMATATQLHRHCICLYSKAFAFALNYDGTYFTWLKVMETTMPPHMTIVYKYLTWWGLYVIPRLMYIFHMYIDAY